MLSLVVVFVGCSFFELLFSTLSSCLRFTRKLSSFIFFSLSLSPYISRICRKAMNKITKPKTKLMNRTRIRTNNHFFLVPKYHYALKIKKKLLNKGTKRNNQTRKKRWSAEKRLVQWEIRFWFASVAHFLFFFILALLLLCIHQSFYIYFWILLDISCCLMMLDFFFGKCNKKQFVHFVVFRSIRRSFIHYADGLLFWIKKKLSKFIIAKFNDRNSSSTFLSPHNECIGWREQQHLFYGLNLINNGKNFI